MFFWNTEYSFWLLYMVCFLLISTLQNRRVPFCSQLTDGLVLLKCCGSNINLYKQIWAFSCSSYFTGHYFLCTSKGPYLC